MKKVELLAPAGSFESFTAAISAGADAVYLGGMKYGARAYAQNFDEDSLCRAVFYAHLFDRKVYLTLNTLMKQSELEETKEFLMPFYKAGLDGVIVQDLGLFSYLKRNFPLLELHISTQMALTGPKSVKMLKEEGAVRVVPARELSLEEIKLLKAQGTEIETFIHGAMCYCYSGQCFFSSFLGGRSGNRGKCAQSCRLPYKVHLAEEKKKKTAAEEYPLSLKDMCSLTLLPDLIEAGIDSFKIEGRMKRPEYVAGVTSVYRKYIDLYYREGKKGFVIAAEDMELLKSLYIRTEIQDGYYKRQNGREMVTLHKPSYSGMDEKKAEEIYDTYVKNPIKANVKAKAFLKKGQPAALTLSFKGFEIQCKGDIVQQAQKRAMTAAEVTKQLCKTGNTDFIFRDPIVDMEEDIFIPLKSLNELRRQALELLEEKIRSCVRKEREESLGNSKSKAGSLIEKESKITSGNETAVSGSSSKAIHILVSSKEQCLKALSMDKIQRIYISCDLLSENCKELIEKLETAAKTKEIWLKFPEVLRNKDIEKIERILTLADMFAAGVLISNLESYAYLKETGYTGACALNYHMYVWNQETAVFWENKIDSFLMPVECNHHEWKNLQHPKSEYLCYGKIPMMVTANCIRKTQGNCRKQGVSFSDSITDRYQKEFAVQTNCNYCYNVIYNSVPLSLHQYMDQIKKLSGKALRFDFTTESALEMEQILNGYLETAENADFSFPGEYTTGHYKKGAL